MDALWPIMDIEHDCLLSKQGDISIVYKAVLPEIFSLSSHEYEAFHQSWVKAIKTLPVFCIVHKQDWFLSMHYQADFSDGGGSFLNHHSELYFNERPYLQQCSYIILTKKPQRRMHANSLFCGLFDKSFVPPETLDQKLLQDFVDRGSQFKHILEDSGFIRLSRLENNDLRSLNRKIGLLEKYCLLAENDDSFVYKDICFEDGLQVGDKYCLLYSLGDAVDLPHLCCSGINYEHYCTDKTKFSLGFASSLGQLLSCNHIYNQYVFIEDAQKTLQNLERKKLRLQSLSTYSRANGMARDAVEEFLNEAVSEQRLAVKAHFNILTWTTKKEQLHEIKNKIGAALSQLDAAAKLESVGAPQIYWAGIPGNAADFPMNDTFDTFVEQAVCFFNMEGCSRSSLSPVGLRLGDRISGRPLHVDISDEAIKKGICSNRNKFILGPSGSGKSFFTNHMVRSYYEQGAHILLVDVGNSYKGLCELVGGSYFAYDEKNPIGFNPFYDGNGKPLDTEKKESLKSLLLALWKKDNECFNRCEYVAISDALHLFFAKLVKQSSVFPCFNSFYEFLKEDFVRILESDNLKVKDFDIHNFLYVLRPYYKGGEFDYLLNATKNLELLEERFIVFELDTIKDHPILFPVVTIVIMEVFMSKMRKLKGIRKMILIEEAWKAIAREGMADYIRYLFKTVRKFYGEAIVVTQDIEDIISSTVVKQAIINNSDCKILMDQSKYQNKFDQIQELLGLSDKEKNLLFSLNKANDPTYKYKEVFISLGGIFSRVYRTEVSLAEYFTYTTEETERLKVSAYAQKFGGDIKKGIAALVNDINNACE